MIEEADVRRAARRLDIDLGADAVRSLARRASRTADRADSLVPDPACDTAATAVTDGDDPHNAIRHRFSLPASGEGLDLSVAVKDNVAVAGVPRHCGSAALSFVPDRHATAVARLAGAGADVVATTNMDEFAYFTTGETCAFGRVGNPRREGRVPGGSSAGSGAAVAAGLVGAALGTDTAGSVRIPASYCGVVGLRPTRGAVSRFGVADLAPSLDCVGTLAGDVATAARVHDAIAGPDPHDRATRADPTAATAGVDAPIEDCRLGVVDPAPADDEVQSALDRALSALSGAGAEIDRVSLPRYGAATTAALAIVRSEFAALVASGGVLPGVEAADGWRSALLEAIASPRLGTGVRDQVVIATALLAAGTHRYGAARSVAAAFTRAVEDALADRDALVVPTTPTTAPEWGAVGDHEAFLRTVENTAPFSLTGHPALSVPVDTDGLPVGVQFVGPRGGERRLVALGSALEGS